MMFSKDGVFAQSFEKQAWDENDATQKRMKIAVCCAETNSINTRLAEIMKELEKCPYKLGLLLVTVQNDAQAVSIQSTLQSKAAQADEPRLTIALLKNPLNDETRKKWLTAITKQEMASDAGQTGAVNQYKNEAAIIVSSWVSSVVSGGKIIAYNVNNVFNSIFGMAHLRKTIRTNVQDVIFPNAPENIVITNTAYKSCNDGAPAAGVQRKSNNAQLNNVLNSLKLAGVLDLTSIAEIADAKGSKQAECVAALAKLIQIEMESGRKVNLGDLWCTLQKPPFGYYNTIACGILLGFVFSCYKNSKYTWTDSVQSPHVLAEATIGKMILNMCGGKMTTDYLSAGSITWQNFSEYLSKIFDLSVAQLAEQTSGYHNVREAVTKSGAPFWVLKYLPDSSWSSVDLHDTAAKVIDDIQIFITQDGDVEGAMSDALQLLQGRGKIRVVLAKSFQDKNAMAAAFRSFLFDASPELKEIATKLSVQPEELSDKIHSVMQGAIYTWTEDQVKEKLADVSSEYEYLESIGILQSTVYHNVETAKKDMANLFKFLRIAMPAIEKLKKPWYPALEILYRFSKNGTAHLEPKEREKDIAVLNQYGVFAKDCLSDGKPILGDILAAKQIECTPDELATVYAGLKDLTCDATLTQFEKELTVQLSRISFARNKKTLQEIWVTMTGEQSVKEWCNSHGVPLMWIIPKDLQKPFETLIDVQKKNHTVDSAVVAAINALKSMDETILTNEAKIEAAFISLIGQEYADIWNADRVALITETKLKIGNDMSTWSASDLIVLQKIIKKAQQEKAKKEKLAGTKNNVRSMNEAILRDRVSAFLDAHPEFCDDFAE